MRVSDVRFGAASRHAVLPRFSTREMVDCDSRSQRPGQGLHRMHVDPDIPEVVASGLCEQEATVLVEHLRAHGFVARSWGTLCSLYSEAPDMAGIQIVVRRSEADSARRSLGEFRRRPHSLAPVVTVRLGR